MSSGAHRRAGRPSLVLLQLLVFVFYIFGPTGTLAEEPAADPSPTESAAPADPTSEPSTDPTTAPDPTSAPSEAPATPAPTVVPPAAPEPSDAPAPTEAPPAPAAPGTEPYLITFASGTSAAAHAAILDAAGVTDVSAIPQLAIHSILLHADALASELATLRANSGVVRVEADRVRDAGAAPSDPSYADQWALPKVGWDELYGTVGIGGSATVAVLDTGVDASHPDLDGVVLPGTSVLDGSDGRTDPNGHGTWMAGIVAAETGNADGIAGTAYAGVSVLPVTVLGADGTGNDSDIIAGVVYAADAGADVILMSFSNPGFSAALQAAIDYAWASGTVLVAAAGNDGASSATFPAGDRGVVGVAATDPSDNLTLLSNYGPSAFMAAPGLDILTTARGGSTSFISGTSASAAMVAGAAALLKANESFLSNGEIVGRLARNADPAGDPAATGNGRLNLLRAMADTSTDAVQPDGAAPVGDGGPMVGPYVAAARNWALIFSGTGGGSVTITPSTGDVDAETGCGGTGSPAASQTVESTCDSSGAGRITSSVNGAVITLQATPDAGSTFGGWTDDDNVDESTSVAAANKTCTDQDPIDLTSPCKLIFAGNGGITVIFNAAAAAQRPVIDLNGSGAANPGIDNSASFTEDAGAVTLASGANVTDADSANLASAQVRLTNRPDGAAESLSVTGCVAGITVTAYNSTTGVLALSGSSSLANYQACLRLVTYNNTDQDPDATARSIEWTVNDGALANSPLAFTTLSVTPVNDRPVIDLNGATAGIDNSASFTEDAGAVTLASGANVTDADSANLASAQVRLTNRPDGAAESLSVTGCVAGITVTAYNSTTGVLALSGSSSLANYQACLRLVTYNNTDQDPDATARSIEWTVNDGALANSPLAFTTLSVTPVNDRPVIDLNGATAGIDNSASFTEDAGAVTLASGANVTDADSANLASAQVRLTNRPDGAAESLSVTGCVAGITVTAYNSTTGVLALSGSSSLANYQACLRLVTYNNTDQDPDATARSIEWTVNDGALANSPLAFTTLSVTPVNDRPVIDLNGATAGIDNSASFTEDAGAVTLASGANVTDADSANLASAQVRLTNRPDGAAESLSVTGCVAGITVTAYNSTTGVLALSGSSSLANYQACLRLVTYNNTDQDPDATARSIEWTVNDGALANSPLAFTTLSVTPVNDAPTVAFIAPIVNSAEEGETKTFKFEVTDPDSTTFSVAPTYPNCIGGGSYVALSLTLTPPTGTFQCLFPDGVDSSTAQIQVADFEGALSNVAMQAVSVANVAPVVTAAADQTANEGTSKSFSLGSFTDPGDDDPWTVIVNWGDGNTDTFVDSQATPGTITARSHTYADDATYTVTVTVRETGGAGAPSGSDTFDIVVANVAPVVTAAADQTANEGTSKSFSLGSFTDPGDDDPWTVIVNWGDGNTDTFVDSQATPGTITARSHTYADDATYTVTVTVRETGGAGAPSGSDTFDIVVANVAPVVTAAADQTANEGTSKSFSLGSFTDPGDDDPWTVIVNWGDGNTDTFVDSQATPGTITARSHTYADDATYTVTVTVRETGGAGAPSGSDTFDIVVANVAPVVTAAADQTANEGTSKSFSLGSFTDPGDDDPWTVIVNWGDGNTDTFVDSQATPGTITARSHTYADDATYTVTVTVRETGGAGAPSGSDTFDIVVANVAPVVTAAADQTANEGTSKSFSLGSFTDPGDDDPWTVIVNWGDGNTDTFVDSQATPGTITARSHTYADDATYTVTVTVRETGGAGAPSGSDTFDIVVANVAPVVTAAADQTANEGTSKSFSLGSFTDPGDDDPWTVIVNWGDGNTDTFVDSQATPGTITARSHTYADDATYTVTVTVRETGGAGAPSGSDTFDIVVANVAPVASDPTFTTTPTVGGWNVMAAFKYSDLGADTQTATFKWTINATTSTTTKPGLAPAQPANPASVADTKFLAPGCYTISIEMYVTDDGGLQSNHVLAGTGLSPIDIYAASFQAPIKDNERNIAKYGNVVPIKVELKSMCFPGTTITNKALYITIVEGNAADVVPDTTPTILAESVSNADTDNVMRVNGGGYMYNFSTKQLKQGQDYTIRIRDGSATGPIILKALFQPKK